MFNSSINSNLSGTPGGGFSFPNPNLGNTGSGSSGSSTDVSFGIPSFGSFPPPSPPPAHNQITVTSTQNSQDGTPRSLFGGLVNNTGWASVNAQSSPFNTPGPSTTATGAPLPATGLFRSMATARGSMFGAPSPSSGDPAITSQPSVVSAPVNASPLFATGRPGTSHGYTTTAQTTSPFSGLTIPFAPAASNMFNAAKNSAATPATGAQSPFSQALSAKNQVPSVFASATAPASAFNAASTTQTSIFAPSVSSVKSAFGSTGPSLTPAAKAPSMFAPPSSVPPGRLFTNSTPTTALGPTAVSSVTPLFPSVAPSSTPCFGSAAPVKPSVPAPTTPTQTTISGLNSTSTSTSLAPNATNNSIQAVPVPTSTMSLPQTIPFSSQRNNRPQESRLKGKSLEEITNQWASDFEKYKKEFHKCGSDISKWDSIFSESSDKIVNLTTEVKEAERTQSIISNALEQLENEQEHMEKLFDYYEASLAEMEKESVEAQPTDAEREQIFGTIMVLSAKLTDMETGTADLVSALNNASAKVENIGTDNHFSYIVRILNEHLQVMQWVDTQTVALSEKIQTVRVNSRASYVGTDGDDIMRNFDTSHRVKF